MHYPTREDRPAAEDAAEATRNSIALADGPLWPCWSWDGESKLWSGKFDLAGNGVDGLWKGPRTPARSR